MKITGLQKNSLVDYSGRIAAVVFTPGCNFDCFYCHNRVLLCQKAVLRKYESREIFEFLKKRKGFLEGLVISGGEPTLQQGLRIFMQKVKTLGYNLKLDTNGSCPDVIKDLLYRGLVDYIAMDVKAPYRMYDEICGVQVDTRSIEESIDIIMNSGIEYEFRTTVVPQLREEDILEMADYIKGARMYALQQFRPVVKGDIIDYRQLKPPHHGNTLKKMANSVSDYVKKCIVRGI